MELKKDRRFPVLTGIAVFIVFIFIWGTISLGRQKSVAQTERNAATVPRITASGSDVDIQALTNDLLHEIEYETELNLIDSSLANGMLNLSKNAKMELYMGEGTFADELLVIQSGSAEDAKKDQTAVENHLKEMKQSFEDYIPEQADKITQAVIIRCGCYVIACVTLDAEQAQEMIVEAFQQ